MKDYLHDDLMHTMATLSSRAEMDEPWGHVGIFWYSAVDQKCFGVSKVLLMEADTFSGELGRVKTTKVLHRDYWKLLAQRFPFEKRYTGNYMNLPRGRVF